MKQITLTSLFFSFFAIVFIGCKDPKDTAILTHDSAAVSQIYDTSTQLTLQPQQKVDSVIPGNIAHNQSKADSIVAFAKSLLGVPYKYASTNPVQGFDCSGFITYVFNYFRMEVPRSSIDFTNVGTTIPAVRAVPGDLILFTGTDTAETKVGHMGIIVNNTDSLRFIHASSGHANGVTITPLNDYYKSRFVKVIRIL